MTRVGFELQTSRLVAYVVPHYATEAAGMMGLSCLYKTRKQVVVDSHSVIGCRVRKLGIYIHNGSIRNHYDKKIQ